MYSTLQRVMTSSNQFALQSKVHQRHTVSVDSFMIVTVCASSLNPNLTHWSKLGSKSTCKLYRYFDQKSTYSHNKSIVLHKRQALQCNGNIGRDLVPIIDQCVSQSTTILTTSSSLAVAVIGLRMQRCFILRAGHTQFKILLISFVCLIISIVECVQSRCVLCLKTQRPTGPSLISDSFYAVFGTIFWRRNLCSKWFTVGRL